MLTVVPLVYTPGRGIAAPLLPAVRAPMDTPTRQVAEALPALPILEVEGMAEARAGQAKNQEL